MKNLKIKILTVFLLIIICIFSYKYVFFNKNTGDEQNTFNVGVTLPLSGDLSMYGESILNGLMIGIEEKNSGGPIKLNLKISDNRGDTKLAVGDVKRFIDIDNSIAIVNAMEHLSMATRGIVDEYKIPMMMSTTYTLKQKDSPRYLFRDYWDFNVVGSKFSSFLHQNNVSSIKIIAQNDNSYSDFKNSITNGYIKVSDEERFNFGSKDFRGLIAKMNINSSDALIIYAYPVEVSVLIKQLSEMNIRPRFLLITEATEYPTVSNANSMNYLSEIGAISYYSSNMINNQGFVDKYKSKYNFSPRVDAFYAYEDSKILYDSAVKCLETEERINSDCLISNIKNNGFDANHNKVRDLPLVRFEEGSFVVVN